MMGSTSEPVASEIKASLFNVRKSRFLPHLSAQSSHISTFYTSGSGAMYVVFRSEVTRIFPLARHKTVQQCAGPAQDTRIDFPSFANA